MKKIILFYSLLTGLSAFAQGDSMYVSGRFLYNHCNETVILRGVNYPVLDDWDFPANMNNGNERISEIEKSGANCVRIQWHNKYDDPQRGPYSLKDLDSLLTRCARAKMIPIVSLGDLTSNGDWSIFPQIITAWWIQPAVVQLIKKHQRYLIINPANEFGHFNWGDNNAQTNIINFENNYKVCITTLRNAGIHVPIMIDAPDGGQQMKVLIQVGQSLLAADPLKNILFDVHTYWKVYPTLNPTQAEIENEFLLAKASNLAFVIGEVANIQPGDNSQCTYDISNIYPEVLKVAKLYEIGWMAWCWHKDTCSDRELSSTGLFNNLTPWGNDFINNVEYGIKNSRRTITTFEQCLCVATRFYRKKCISRRRVFYVNCTVYKNRITGQICETKCESCHPEIGPRPF